MDLLTDERPWERGWEKLEPMMRDRNRQKFYSSHTWILFTVFLVLRSLFFL